MTTILDRIGNTSLLPLRNIASNVLLKIESENPTGSMKDRMALAMIEAAEADGRLEPGGAVVEYTAGSTGVALALVCGVKRHPLYIVSSDAFAQEKLLHMRILGATLQILHSDSGGMSEKLTRDMIAAAQEIAAKNGAYLTDQMKNTDAIPAYYKMANEIWSQTDGRIDVFIQAVGTGGSIRGNSERLRQLNPKIKVVAVEPAESPVLSGGKSGSHKIDGIGAGYVVPMWNDRIADQIERVSTEEARNMALRLAREEGLFAGTSTGANVVAASRVASQMPRSTIVTIMVDTGMKYLKNYAEK